MRGLAFGYGFASPLRGAVPRGHSADVQRGGSYNPLCRKRQEFRGNKAQEEVSHHFIYRSALPEASVIKARKTNSSGVLINVHSISSAPLAPLRRARTVRWAASRPLFALSFPCLIRVASGLRWSTRTPAGAGPPGLRAGRARIGPPVWAYPGSRCDEQRPFSSAAVRRS